MEMLPSELREFENRFVLYGGEVQILGGASHPF